jgi:hypothetical protein
MRNETRRLLALVMVWGYLLALVSPMRAEPRAQNGPDLTGGGTARTLPTLPPMAPPADRAKADQHVPTNQPSTSKSTPAVHTTKLAAGAAAFIENRGQFDARAKFQWKSGGRTLWLTEQGIVFDAIRPKAGETATATHEPGRSALQSSDPTRASRGYDRLVFAEEFLGTHYAPAIEASQPLPGRYHYFLGNDPQHWHTNVPGYAEVVYRDVWEGIDLKLSRNGPDLEQEFIVRPGGDLTQVRVAFRGIDGLQVADDGSLVVRTAFGEFRESPPRIYQEIAGQRVAVEGRFILTSPTAYTFEVKNYNPQYALVIDPTVLYSTFLGGSGDDQGNGIAVDSSGKAYVTGTTSSTNFPTTPGALEPTKPSPNSGCSATALVTKLSALGNALVYSTYFGADCTRAFAIAVNSAGEAYVAGGLAYSNFPTTANAFQTGCSASTFLTKFNAQGDGLLYSTCLGGGSGNVRGVALDATGNAYLTGEGGGGGADFFPTTPGAFQRQSAQSTGPSAFVAVLNPSASGTSSLIYSTYLGGVSTTFFGDGGTGIAVDVFSMIYVTGATTSPNFPVTAGAFLTTFPADNCRTGCAANIATPVPGLLPTAFVAKLNPLASGPASLIYSTFLGGSFGTYGSGIAVDTSGSTYVTGNTGRAFGSPGSIVPFPTTPGAYQSVLDSIDVFVTKLNAAGNGLVYSTLLGGSAGNNESFGTGIALDSSGNAYVTGSTRSSGFPTTPDAFQPFIPVTSILIMPLLPSLMPQALR